MNGWAAVIAPASVQPGAAGFGARNPVLHGDAGALQRRLSNYGAPWPAPLPEITGMWYPIPACPWPNGAIPVEPTGVETDGNFSLAQPNTTPQAVPLGNEGLGTAHMSHRPPPLSAGRQPGSAGPSVEEHDETVTVHHNVNQSTECKTDVALSSAAAPAKDPFPPRAEPATLHALVLTDKPRAPPASALDEEPVLKVPPTTVPVGIVPARPTSALAELTEEDDDVTAESASPNLKDVEEAWDTEFNGDDVDAGPKTEKKAERITRAATEGTSGDRARSSSTDAAGDDGARAGEEWHTSSIIKRFLRGGTSEPSAPTVSPPDEGSSCVEACRVLETRTKLVMSQFALAASPSGHVPAESPSPQSERDDGTLDSSTSWATGQLLSAECHFSLPPSITKVRFTDNTTEPPVAAARANSPSDPARPQREEHDPGLGGIVSLSRQESLPAKFSSLIADAFDSAPSPAGEAISGTAGSPLQRVRAAEPLQCTSAEAPKASNPKSDPPRAEPKMALRRENSFYWSRKQPQRPPPPLGAAAAGHSCPQLSAPRAHDKPSDVVVKRTTSFRRADSASLKAADISPAFTGALLPKAPPPILVRNPSFAPKVRVISPGPAVDLWEAVSSLEGNDSALSLTS